MNNNVESYDMDADGSSGLDHALLESLFYNEMAMMDDMPGLLGLFDTSSTSSSSLSYPVSGVDYNVNNEVEPMLLFDNSNDQSTYIPLHLPTESFVTTTPADPEPNPDAYESSLLNDMDTGTILPNTNISGVSSDTPWGTAPLSSSMPANPMSHQQRTVMPGGNNVISMPMSNATQQPTRLTPDELIALTQNRPNRGIRHNVTSTSTSGATSAAYPPNSVTGTMNNLPSSSEQQSHPVTTVNNAINASYGAIYTSISNNNSTFSGSNSNHAPIISSVPNPLGYLSNSPDPVSVMPAPMHYQIVNPAVIPVTVESAAPISALATHNNFNQPIAPTTQVHPAGTATQNSVTSQNNSMTEANSPKIEPTNDDKKRTKLLSQFATLASRLGITLPPQVLKHLTDGKTTTISTDILHARPAIPNQTSIMKPSGFGSITTTSTAASASADMVQSSTLGKDDDGSPILSKVHSSAILELQATAAEAIAAATSRKRFSPENSSDEEDDNTTNGGKKKSGNSKVYSKRRKKPRLNECETKLAELRAENEMLKRHLDNISNKTAKLEQERIEVEKTMRRMFDSGAPDAEIDQLLKNYSDMYSDYGKKRDQELSFHLEQLRRLANPTNFTKMGLWTLSQDNSDSSNPIAGILQKELAITPQQGRKVLEHRQKIQRVCMNLKECLVLLGKLKSLCEQKTKIFHDRMEKTREILSPKQVVKLLMWINENSSTLGSVCPGWGSEQFQATKAKATKIKTTNDQ